MGNCCLGGAKGAPLCQAAFLGERRVAKGKAGWNVFQEQQRSVLMQNSKMPGSRSHQSHPPRVKPSAFRERAGAWPRWEENSGFRTGSPPDPQPSWNSANLRERGHDSGPWPDHPPALPVPSVGYWADGRDDSDIRALLMEEGAGRMGRGQPTRAHMVP